MMTRGEFGWNDVRFAPTASPTAGTERTEFLARLVVCGLDLVHVWHSESFSWFRIQAIARDDLHLPKKLVIF